MGKGTVEQLQKIITDSQNIVFFGGAGVSTESGIPVSSAVGLSAGSDFEPLFFYEKSGRILSVLQGENAL